jgi:IclR family transcriptional regulator, acetate operon repressor
MAAQLISRVLDLIEFLSECPEGIPLSEICRQKNLPKGAVHRILAAMKDRGFVDQDARSEYYRLTLKTAAIGFRLLAESKVTDVCQPILDRLAAQSSELVRLAIATGDTLTWTAKAQGASNGLRYDPDMGQPVVLHGTAVGRAWLATMAEESAVKIVLARGFKVPARFNRCIVSNEKTLRAELNATRKRGYGLAIEEGVVGTIAVAIPIFVGPAKSRAAVGTVSVAGPVARIGGQRIKEIVDDLRFAAAELSSVWPMQQFLAPVSSKSSEPSPKRKRRS